MRNSLIVICFAFNTLLLSGNVMGQNVEGDPEKYQQEAKDLISFLEYTFNAMGGNDLSPKEKSVIVNNSYLKIFRDNKVQIEDDLVQGREVVTNKDVQAYLKDIDYFFQKAKFELNIEDIKFGVNENDKTYIVITVNRNLQGIGIEGDSINNNVKRFIEVNVNEEEQDMKIVSIYTTKLGEREELIRWWVTLPPAWKQILGKDIQVTDQYRLNEIGVLSDSLMIVGGKELTKDELDIFPYIKKVTEIEEIDISDHPDLSTIRPLNELTNVKKLDVSGTAINSIVPLRNLTTLEFLDLQNTTVDDISALRYCLGIKQLNISYTNVRQLEVISDFSRLESLHADDLFIDSIKVIEEAVQLKDLSLANATVVNYDFLRSLKNLEFLNLSNTNIRDVTPISNLEKLKTLDLSGTKISNIESLKNNEELEFLNISGTEVNSLKPLTETNIHKVFCDNSGVDKKAVAELIAARPDCIVIFKSDALQSWWNNMPDSWQDVFEQSIDLGSGPSTEQLHMLLKLDSINVSGIPDIVNLDPLEQLFRLEVLMCANTPVKSLEPISDQISMRKIDVSNTSVFSLTPLAKMHDLEYVNCTNTPVKDISVFKGFDKLSDLYFDHTLVGDVSVINTLPSFRIGYFDSTYVDDKKVADLNYDGTKATLIYKTARLRDWWGNLRDEWQDIFRKAVTLDGRPTREQLHNLTGLQKFEVKSIIIDNIAPMQEFIRLRELKFNDTQIKSLMPLSSMQNLEVLDCSRNPIEEIEPLRTLTNLRIIYLNNTQIDELDALKNLKKLEELYVSSTEVKHLDPLEGHDKLRIIDCSNTKVRRLNDIEELPNLESVRCYNTRINSNRVDDFKALHPDCEVVFY